MKKEKTKRAVAIGLVALLSVACSSPDRRDDGQSQASSTSDRSSEAVRTPTSASSPLATTPAPPPPTQIHGIVIFNSDSRNGSCVVQTVDPLTGAVAKISEFKTDKSCQLYGATAQYPLSSNFDRIATTIDSSDDLNARAGWYDTNKQFTPIGPAATRPDFGDQRIPSAIGFDKQDNFYYAVTLGSSLDNRIETYRVPKGSTGAGELIGASTEHRYFNRLPGGTLGFADSPVHYCGGSGTSTEYDPDKSINYIAHSSNGIIYKSIQSANCDDKETALTPKSSGKVTSIASSPDGSKIAFKLNSKLYVLDGQVPGSPEIVSAPLGPYWSVQSWR